MKQVIFHTIKWLLNCGADLNQSQSQKKWAQVFQKCDLRTSIQTLKLALTIISMATKKYKHFDLSSWIPYTSCTLCLRAFAHALLTAWNISCSPPSHDIPPISYADFLLLILLLNITITSSRKLIKSIQRGFYINNLCKSRAFCFVPKPQVDEPLIR